MHTPDLNPFVMGRTQYLIHITDDHSVTLWADNEDEALEKAHWSQYYTSRVPRTFGVWAVEIIGGK